MSVKVGNYFGRRVIYSSEQEVTRDNVLNVIFERAVQTHQANAIEIEYLYNYYKGKQPVLYRTKEVRNEINNKVVENRANEIVSFKTGFYVGEPIQYISRGSETSVGEKINTLNDYMVEVGKPTKDKELVEWAMICGTSYRMILASKDENAPFEVFTLDPRDTFVVYSTGVGHKPLCGVICIRDEDNRVIQYAVYTNKEYFLIEEGKIVEHQYHIMRYIPIVEYPANNARLGAFEPVLPLLDALNEIDSNRLDGIEQFIQSLLVVYNATFEDGTTAKTIREQGMIILRNFGEQKADIKEIAQQLDQSQTQTLKNDLYSTVLKIVGMPAQGDANTSDSSNNGAMILKNGWQGAEARAKDYELMFKQSERESLKIILNICNTIDSLGLMLKDIDIKFTRRQYEDLLVKSQVLTTMLASDKIAPELAFTNCGLFSDPQDAYQLSMSYAKEQESKSMERMKIQDGLQNNTEEIPKEET